MSDTTGRERAPARQRNPVLPLGVHMPDCEARLMPDGRLYLYGSLDLREDGYCSSQYRVASTANLAEWTVHPTSFTTANVEWAGAAHPTGRSFLDGIASYAELPDYAVAMLPPGATDVPFDEFAAGVRAATAERQPQEPLLYAPDAIERDGRYYLYFCLSDDSEGVAVSDSPTGPFSTAQRLPISQIDPAVFIDDDGQAYLYWGQFSANVARLNPDMVTLDLESIVEGVLTEAAHHFHEGCSVRKRDGIYYLVFADTSRGKPTCLGYATAISPYGPFEYRGVLIDNEACDPMSWNNHGSIECFSGQWYVFYHRSSRGSSSMRRVCIEPISFGAGGEIDEVPMTSQGAGRPYALGDEIPSYEACSVSGTARIVPFADSEAITDASSGDVAVFRYLENMHTIKSVSVRFEGTCELDVLVDGSLAATLRNGSQVAATEIPPGLHEIAIVFRHSEHAVLLSVQFNAS